MLLFTPGLAKDPWSALAAAMPFVDAIQVRPKPIGDAEPTSNLHVSQARETCDLARKVLHMSAALGQDAPLVFVNDRVDVARVLWEEGLAGVHVGQDDCPPHIARDCLGPGPLLGISTHNASQAVHAAEEAVDYLGFGPIYTSPTKGYSKGLGPDRAWVVAETFELPVFPIGGINALRAPELQRVGRLVAGSAILGAIDPAAAAQELRRALEP